jgi:hypothetical protein
MDRLLGLEHLPTGRAPVLIGRQYRASAPPWQLRAAGMGGRMVSRWLWSVIA